MVQKAGHVFAFGLERFYSELEGIYNITITLLTVRGQELPDTSDVSISPGAGGDLVAMKGLDGFSLFYTPGRGGYRILKGEGPRGNVGQKARMNFATWGTFCAKFAPVWALFPQYVPRLGHSFRKMFPSWGIFCVKCALAGALST